MCVYIYIFQLKCFTTLVSLFYTDTSYTKERYRDVHLHADYII